MFLSVMQKALCWVLYLVLNKMTSRKWNFSLWSFHLFSKQLTEVFGYLKTYANMIILCDRVCSSQKNTLWLLAFRSRSCTQINFAFLSYHQVLLWIHLGKSQASSEEDTKWRKNRACIL